MEKGLAVNNQIDVELFLKGHREFYSMQEFVSAIGRTYKVMSWAARSWTRMNKFCLRFYVSAMHHTGHIYVVVNGADLFDVYITTNRGRIKEVLNDVYLEDFIGILDEKIERIEAYR